MAAASCASRDPYQLDRIRRRHVPGAAAAATSRRRQPDRSHPEVSHGIEVVGPSGDRPVAVAVAGIAGEPPFAIVAGVETEATPRRAGRDVISANGAAGPELAGVVASARAPGRPVSAYDVDRAGEAAQLDPAVREGR